MIGAIIGDVAGSTFEFTPLQDQKLSAVCAGQQLYRRHPDDHCRGAGADPSQ